MRSLFRGTGSSSAALLVLRLAVGIIFILHGYDKLFGAIGMSNFITMVDGIGVPAPVFFAWCAALTEFVGGIAMLLGFATPVFGTLIALTMFVAFTAVKGSALPAGDVDLILFAAAVALVMLGAGRYSVDALLFEKFCKNKQDSECCGAKGSCCA